MTAPSQHGIALVAGEASGDNLGGALVNALSDKSAANISRFVGTMSVEHVAVFMRTARDSGKLKKHFAAFAPLVKRVGAAQLED